MKHRRSNVATSFQNSFTINGFMFDGYFSALRIANRRPSCNNMVHGNDNMD